MACPAEENQKINNTAKNNDDGCKNLCIEGDRKCRNSGAFEVCVKNEDGCLDFAQPQECSSELVCEKGRCVDELDEGCSDLCDFGEFQCTQDGQSQRCVDTDDDGCFEFDDPVACQGEETCSLDSGQCALISCADECELGASTCEGDLVRTCKPGPQGCSVFTPARDCPDGQLCSSGACAAVSSCDDECIAGEKLCGPSGVPRSCEDGNADTCVEFVNKAECGTGEACIAGECTNAQTCQDLCLAGSKSCFGNQISSCRDTDNDGCLELDAPQDCPTPSQTCDSSGAVVECKAVAVVGSVVINEIFYDALLDDVDAQGRASTFIELKGPAGFDVSGFTIDLINGKNGVSYGDVVLPAGSVLDGKGLGLITSANADNFLSRQPGSVFPFLMPYANGQDALQNGSDNVVLKDASGAQVDALGYGSFGGGDVFSGEGTPAQDVYKGRSLGRPVGAADTNDNGADFKSFFPTPGVENSDIVINEIYVNQPGSDGVDGQIETFVELSAPIRGWVDIELEGYTLHAINGFDGMDYIFTGPLDGIVLSSTSPHVPFGMDGLLVICNIEGSDDLLDVCDVPYEGADFQDSPDSFVLRYRGEIVDAVAYGTFSGTEISAGEGTPASFSRADAGKSLSRWPQSDPSKARDTDDNDTDFKRTSPTPRRGNALPLP